MAKVKITQVRSRNGATERQISTLKSLGLRRINHTVERETNQVTCGMIDKVRHLIRVEEI
jgi:large subunit ribosomal protein L30